MPPFQSNQHMSRLIPSPYICQRCLSRYRPLSRLAAACSLPKAFSTSRFLSSSTPPTSGSAHLSTRRLISVAGPDAVHFLQGVISANVNNPRSNTGYYAAFLNAQGRIINDVFIYANVNLSSDKIKPGEAWLIEVDTNEAEKLYKHIRRYKLRSKFEVRLLPQDEFGVWSVWTEEASASQGWTPHTISSPAIAKGSGDVGCEDSRAPGMGQRVILPSGLKPQIEADESNELQYRIRRYMKGVAEGQGEILREASLPQESNLDYMGGIDYRKGCYVGQELTIRTHHTGVVRKRILPVTVYGGEDEMPTTQRYMDGGVDAAVIPQDTQIGRVAKRGRSAGKWLCGVGNVGLGLCRLEIMTDVLVQGEQSGYKEGDEFKLEWEVEGQGSNMVKVKAFVPPWHLNR